MAGDSLFTCTQELSLYIIKIVLLSVLVLLICFSRELSYAKRWLFGSVLFAFFFTLGIELSYNKLSHITTSWIDSESSYIGVLKETPKEKEKSFACKLWIDSNHENGKEHLVGKNCLLYIVKDSLSEKLKSGDILLFRSRITPPRNNGNPGEFDYARYLVRNEISGTGMIYGNKWQITGEDTTFDLKRFALQIRESLLTRYRQVGITGEEFAILSALTLGYKENLTEEIRNSYSVAGTSHILALSGLHIGILFSLLVLCSGIFGKGLFGRVLRTILFLSCLWSFALISGLSPSVVRSVCMFSCLIFSQLLNKRHLSFHLLSVTAFGMLLYNPFYLYDISFQLSFIAVTSILIISPLLKKRFTFTSRLSNYIWELIILSLAAQLGTLPLILYYFNSFPTYFLLANLLVVPLTSLILYLTVIFWGLFLFPILQEYFSFLIVNLIKLLNAIIYFIEGLSFSSVNKIILSPLQVLGLYAVILLLIFSSYFNKGKVIVSILFVFLLFSLEHLYQSIGRERNSSILFYNSSSVAVHLKSGKEYSQILVDNKGSVTLPSHLQSIISQNCRKEKNAFPEIIDIDKSLKTDNYIYCFHDNLICFLIDDYWRYKKTDQPLVVDYLYIHKGYRGMPEDISSLFKAKNIVLHSSMRDQQLTLWLKEGELINAPVYLLSEGAICMPLKRN